MTEFVKNHSFVNSYLFAAPKRTYTLDMFQRKHLVWIPQKKRSPLPCLFISPPKPIAKRRSRKTKRKSNGIPAAPPVPDPIDQIISKIHPGEFLIIYAKGNDMDLGSAYDFCQRLAKKLRMYVLCFEYTGFGFALHKGEQTTPTEASTQRDMRTAYHFVRETIQWPAERIVIYGESIGCGVACYGAAYAQKQLKETIGALFLRSAFTSVEDIIKVYLGPVGTFVLNRFNNKKYLKDVKCPLLITHGEFDDNFPLELSKKLIRGYTGHFLCKLHVAVGEKKQLAELPHVFGPLAQFLVDVTASNDVLEVQIPIPPKIRILDSLRVVPEKFMRAAMPEPITKPIRDITALGFNTVESRVWNKPVVEDSEVLRLTTDEQIEDYLFERITKFCRAIAANHYVRVHEQDSKTTNNMNSSVQCTTFEKPPLQTHNSLPNLFSQIHSSSTDTETKIEAEEQDEITSGDQENEWERHLYDSSTSYTSEESIQRNTKKYKSLRRKRKKESTDRQKNRANFTPAQVRKDLLKWVEGQYWFYSPLLDMYMEIEQLLGYYGPEPVPHVLGATFKSIGASPYGLLHVQLRVGGLLYNWDQLSRAAPTEMYFKHVYNVLKTRCRIPLYLSPCPNEFFISLTSWLQMINVELPFGQFLEDIEEHVPKIVPTLLEFVMPQFKKPDIGKTKLCDKMKVWGKVVLKWEREYYYSASVANCQDFFILNCAALQLKIPGEANKDVQRVAVTEFPESNQEFLFKKSPFSPEIHTHVDKIYKGKRVMGPRFESVEEFIAIFYRGKIEQPDYIIMAAQWYLQVYPQHYEELCWVLRRACKRFRNLAKKYSRHVKTPE